MALENPGIITEIPNDHESSTDKIATGDTNSKPRSLSDEEIVQILETYRTEAEYARLSGPNSRDQTWLMNLDLYWNRYDYSKKAPWQAREVMPELPQYVDRFAAAMREALISSERFFTVQVANDDEGDLGNAIKKLMVAQLRRVGRSPSGHPVDFLVVFEDIMKLGALMMNACVVTSKCYQGQNYTAVEPVDPYNVWLDPTGRNLYRIRRIEVDMHELQGYAKLVDKKGIALYNREEISRCTDSIIALMRAEREKRTGTGQWMSSNRRPVVLHEYRATLIDNEGNVQGEDVLCVVANNTFLIRGPEKNPFWHGRDWLLTSPIITVPLSPYGRGYVENFASLVKTFNELTNLILDGVFTTAMKAFAAVPSMLEDPSQIDEGLYPNVVFRLAEGMDVKDFIKEVNLGQFPPEVVQIWQAIKKEMQEGAAFNDVSLGQLAPKGRTSATEIGTADQNSTSVIRSLARNIEVLLLEPLLDIMWKTTVQHLSKDDKELEDAIGPEWFDVILHNKRKFAEYRIGFIVRGISSTVLKTQKVQHLMQLLQIVQGNPALLQQFMKEVDMGKLIDMLMDLFDIEKERLQPSQRDQLMNELLHKEEQMLQMQQEQMGQAGSTPGQQGPQAPQLGGPQAGPSGQPAGAVPNAMTQLNAQMPGAQNG